LFAASRGRVAADEEGWVPLSLPLAKETPCSLHVGLQTHTHDPPVTTSTSNPPSPPPTPASRDVSPRWQEKSSLASPPWAAGNGEARCWPHRLRCLLCHGPLQPGAATMASGPQHGVDISTSQGSHEATRRRAWMRCSNGITSSPPNPKAARPGVGGARYRVPRGCRHLS
jgi:hypothetical protein